MVRVDGYLGSVKVTFLAFTVYLINVYVPPSRGKKKAIINSLISLMESHNDNDALIYICGDLNLDPSRSEDLPDFDRLKAAASQVGLDMRTTKGPTYRTSEGKGSNLDWCLVPDMREKGVRLGHEVCCWAAPKNSNHAAISCTSALQKGNVKTGLKHQAIPTKVFQHPSAERGQLIRSLVLEAERAGLGALPYAKKGVLEGNLEAIKDITERADRVSLHVHPVNLFHKMEDEIRTWYKSIRGKDLKLGDDKGGGCDKCQAKDCSEISWHQWRDICNQLGMEPGDRESTGKVQIASDKVAALMRLIKASNLKSMPEDKINSVRTQFSRYRMVAGGDPWHNAERVELASGVITSDPAVIAQDRVDTNAFQQNPPDVDFLEQVRFIEYYKKTIRKNTDNQHSPNKQVENEIPDVLETAHIVLNAPPTSPGKGGVPYAAWKLIPLITAMLLRKILVMFITCPLGILAQCPVREQVCTWIPKSQSIRSEDMRELGLSTAFYRLVNRMIRGIYVKIVGPRMHASQMLMRGGVDILEAVDYAQRYLDDTLSNKQKEGMRQGKQSISEDLRELLRLTGSEPDIGHVRFQNFGDLRQAFSHVDPKFVWMVLLAQGIPFWLMAATGFILFNRRSWQKAGGRLHLPVPIQVGTDMGNPMADAAFMTAMDPLLVVLGELPGVARTLAYMDDIAASASLRGSIYFQKAMKCYEVVGPIKIRYHTCYSWHDGRGAAVPVDRRGKIYASHDSGTELAAENGCVTPAPLLACGCKVKFATVPSRHLTPEEMAIFHHAPHGPQILQAKAEYLGLWAHRADIDKPERDRQAYRKPIRKLKARVECYCGVNTSITDKVLVWDVFMNTLFSYVSQLHDLDPDTDGEIRDQMRKFHGLAWWVGTRTFAILLILVKVKRKLLWPHIYARIMATGWIIRTNGNQVAYLTAPSDHYRKIRALESDAKVISQVAGHRHARCADRIIAALDSNTYIDPREAGRVIKSAWELKVCEDHSDMWEKGQNSRRQWPSSMHAEQALDAISRCDINDYGKITLVRWLYGGFAFNGEDLNRRRETCCIAGCHNDGMPDTIGGRKCICKVHWDNLVWEDDVQVWAGDEAIEEILQEPTINHPITRLVPNIRYEHARVITMIADLPLSMGTDKTSPCPLCGKCDASTQHILTGCAVFGLSHLIIYDTAFAWEKVSTLDKAGPGTLVRAVHLLISGGDTLQNNGLQHRTDQLIKFWYHSLAEADRPQHIDNRYRTSFSTPQHKKLLGPTCSICRDTVKGMGELRIAKLGMAEVRDAPRMDRSTNRVCTSREVRSGEVITAWRRYDNRPIDDLVTKVGLGVSFNAELRGSTCKCGAEIAELWATRTLLAGTEIIIQKQTVTDSGCKLVVTFDGGGGQDKEGNEAYGAGCVAYLYSGGVATRILQLPIICQATTAQQAEAVGAMAANNILS